MRDILARERRFNYPMLVIAATALAFMYFHLVLIYTASHLDGTCMHAFWNPTLRPDFSPYWMFVGIVILLMLLAGAWMTDALISQKLDNRVIVSIGSVLLVFLAFWGWRLLSFWQLFLFEADLQSSEYWLSVFRSEFEAQTKCEPRS